MPTRTIHLDDPLELTRTLAIHRRGSGDPTMRLLPGGVLRATRTTDGPATVELHQAGDRVHTGAWGPGADAALEALPALIGLDDDRTGFEPGHHPLVRELDRLGVDTLVDAAHAPGILPLDVRGLGAAWWTGNGHKWLCGTKGAGMLYVREDKRADVRPLVTSHGRNDPRPDRPALWKEFDWQGTSDPTAFLSLPEALRVIGSLDPGGWPAHMASNHAKAVDARRLLNDRLGLEPIAPESMLGTMASIALPIEPDEVTTEALSRSLADDEGFEVPVGPFPVRACRVPGQPPARALLRISAQRYNEPSDYERLADALVRRGLAARVPATGSGIVAG